MKQRWLQLAARIDLLTLRQRVGLFAACTFAVLYLFYLYGFAPLLREQTSLRDQIGQQHMDLAGIDGQMTSLLEAFSRDPDAASRARVAAARLETRTLSDSLAAMQKGLAAPEQMAPLLQSILRANGRLQLVSLTTLPVTAVGAAAADPADPAKPGGAAPTSTPAMAGLLYRHGVQVTVRGSYPDMIEYMAALENLPAQLFWGPAQLTVEDYPRANVTLTLYTLSLDSKWLKL